MRPIIALLVMASLVGCASAPASPAVSAEDVKALTGSWRGWLVTDQGFNLINFDIRPDGSFEVSGARVRGAGILVVTDGTLRFDGTGPWRGTLVPEGAALKLLRDDHLYRGTLHLVPQPG